MAVSGRTALGAHALVTHDQGKGTSPATTPPVTTQPSGSLLLAVSMGRTVNFVAPTDSYGNTWKPIGKRHAYADGPFYTAISVAGPRVVTFPGESGLPRRGYS